MLALAFLIVNILVPNPQIEARKHFKGLKISLLNFITARHCRYDWGFTQKAFKSFQKLSSSFQAAFKDTAFKTAFKQLSRTDAR